MFKRCIAVILACSMISVPAYAKQQTNFTSKVYALEKSLGTYYDVMEFNGTAKEYSPEEGFEESVALSDIKGSFEARKDAVNRFSGFGKMKKEDCWALREIAVLVEYNLYDKYKDKNPESDDSRLNILCRSYIDGIKMQLDAVQGCKDLSNIPKEERINKESLLEQQYMDGCRMRESVLLELDALYGLGIDTEGLVVNSDFEKMVADAKAAGYSQDLVRIVQSALNKEGFNAGDEDGIIGKTTVLAIYDYKRAKGMEPDGMISDDLITSLDIQL